jgi:hypothetical protein
MKSAPNFRSIRQAYAAVAARGTVLVAAVLCLFATGCFRVSSDLRALREGILKSSPADWKEEIEVGVGALTLSVARAGLGFLDLPSEARTALDAARGAEVGIYRLEKSRGKADRAAMLKAADHAMLDAGWDRLVTVVDDGNLVVVYVPESLRSTRNLKVCVVVFDGRQLVLASARSNLEPLLDLALSKAGWQENGKFAFRF